MTLELLRSLLVHLLLIDTLLVPDQILNFKVVHHGFLAQPIQHCVVMSVYNVLVVDFVVVWFIRVLQSRDLVHV